MRTEEQKALLRAGLASVEASEAGRSDLPWDQGRWRCGTGGCMAAHIGFAAGWRWVDPPSLDPDDDSAMMTNGQETDLAWFLAAELTGLSAVEEAVLFATSNTLDNLRRMVDELTRDE